MSIEYVESPLLGKSEVLKGKDLELLEDLIARAPLNVFQRLNKVFNSKGMLISITILEDKK